MCVLGERVRACAYRPRQLRLERRERGGGREKEGGKRETGGPGWVDLWVGQWWEGERHGGSEGGRREGKGVDGLEGGRAERGMGWGFGRVGGREGGREGEQ